METNQLNSIKKTTMRQIEDQAVKVAHYLKTEGSGELQAEADILVEMIQAERENMKSISWFLQDLANKT